MLPYSLLKPLVFSLDPETAHDATIACLRLQGALLPPSPTPQTIPIEVMGIKFPNRIGLAAGMDKNASAIDGLARLGFGFIEVGTVTPRAQSGNPRPRLFRLPQQKAIINRMGFNNHGVVEIIENIRNSHYYKQAGILGINIGKNASTPISQANDDYLFTLKQVYPYASYITINISSPNTSNLRQLQNQSELESLLAELKQKQQELAQQHGKHVPLALKISPDINETQISQVADSVRRHRIEALIATNTTVERTGLSGDNSQQSGGLSGKPLLALSTRVLHSFAEKLAGEIPLIASGGVCSAEDALSKLEAGAQLVQIYSGLIYHGPELIKKCVAATAGYLSSH